MINFHSNDDDFTETPFLNNDFLNDNLSAREPEIPRLICFKKDFTIDSQIAGGKIKK